MSDLTPIQTFAIWILPVLFGITLHEVAHGWAALKFGDKTAFMLGRLTINPLKHIDPIGTVLVPSVLFMLGGFIFGWAKPVPVTWENLKNPKRDMAIVAIAGPLANLAMALTWGLLAKIGLLLQTQMPQSALALLYMGHAGIIINLILMVLNLVPVPPLDGSRVVTSFLPGRFAWQYNRLEPYGIFILLALIMTGLLFKLIAPPIMALRDVILTLFGLG